MKRPALLIAITVAATATVFTSCRTTTSTAPSEDRFAKADTNHDGKLSRDEANTYFVTIIFESRDLNHDGKLTWEEWNVPGSGRSKARFDAADTNKDGSVSLDEAVAYGRKRDVYKKEFDEADTNHDGYVSKAEAQAYSASKEGPPN
jgi:hypothetical protein